MARQIITTASAPSSPYYSQAVTAGSHVHVSGMVGVDVSTGKLSGDTIQDQTRQALKIARPSFRPLAPTWTTSSRWVYYSPTPPTSPA